jgi:hypothetical protein
VKKEAAKARWTRGVPEDKVGALIPPGVFDQWWDATIATDPIGSKIDPPMLRAASGVTAEFVNYWLAGKPYYDPGPHHRADPAHSCGMGRRSSDLNG